MDLAGQDHQVDAVEDLDALGTRGMEVPDLEQRWGGSWRGRVHMPESREQGGLALWP